MDIHTAETLAKAIVRRKVEMVNKGDAEGLERLLAPGLADGLPEPRQGALLRGGETFVAGFLSAFPDWQARIEIMIADGGTVAYRWQGEGAHQAPFMGLAPTGKRVTLTGLAIDRIEEGRIVEAWGEADMLGLLRQLGAVSALAHSGS